jgi:hypothetical protein
MSWDDACIVTPDFDEVMEPHLLPTPFHIDYVYGHDSWDSWDRLPQWKRDMATEADYLNIEDLSADIENGAD